MSSDNGKFIFIAEDGRIQTVPQNNKTPFSCHNVLPHIFAFTQITRQLNITSNGFYRILHIWRVNITLRDVPPVMLFLFLYTDIYICLQTNHQTVIEVIHFPGAFLPHYLIYQTYTCSTSSNGFFRILSTWCVIMALTDVPPRMLLLF